MKVTRLVFILPALALIGSSAFGDEPGQQQQRPNPPQQQQQQYDDQQQQPAPNYQYYDDQQGQFDPGQQYYCANNCAQAPMPYPPAVLPMPVAPPVVYPVVPAPPPIIVRPPVAIQPIYPPAILPAHPIIRPRPMPYGYGGRPRPTPYYGNGYRGPQAGRPMPYNRGAQFRRMSLGGGCEIQQANNGEFVVISRADRVIYSDKSVHAEANAKAMKAYYENAGFGLCEDAAVKNRTTQDI